MANIKNAVKLGVFTLAIMNVTAVVSLRGLPAEAVYGMSSAFYYLFAAIVFLIPTSLVAAELAAMFQDKQGGVFRGVGEAYGKKLGFLAIWVQWIESTIWYPTVLTFGAVSIAFIGMNDVHDMSLANNKYYTLIVVLVIYWLATFISLKGMSWVGKVAKIGGMVGTIIPALVLVFDGPIEKTRHKLLLSNLDKPSAFITKHYKAWIVIFLVLLFPAIYGNNHTKIYYNIAQSLPSTLDCNIANDELKKDFNLSNMHIIMLDKGMSAKDKEEMFKKIDDVDGVKWTLGMNSLVGAGVPDSMIPDDVKSMLESDDHELAFVCSKYESATDEVNAQIAQIDKIVKKYDDTGMVIGEAPLMKDLEDVTNVDLVRVNAISIIAIFIIILLVFKSISLPIILVAVIEFAIFVNMAIPYYQGISLPFVASIVIGAIQLGATVDYAILMTTRYQKERMKGKDKMEAIGIAHRTSMPSIISSGLSFFAATFGVACYSKVEMIGSICTLLARGAIISTVVVLLVLPAMFMIFDKVIIKTTKGFKQEQLESTPSAS